MEYAIIDIETSGGDPKKDRITEIAIYRYDGERVVDEFISLINPGVPIPANISRMTGITNDMVATAPKFYEVAKRIVEITEGAVFVAHNVRFDYGFVQREFRNLGYTYMRKNLCTVQMSRRILPGYPSYSLGNICASLGIRIGDRHRAYGDAFATVQLFEMLLRQDHEATMQMVIKEQIATVKIPTNLPAGVAETLPEETGVYYFHDADGNVIYVGKSTNIRSRVMSHFQESNKILRKMNMSEQMYDITYELTGSELIALLLENDEIKRLQPRFNRAQRRTNFKYGLFVEPNADNYLELHVKPLNGKELPVLSFTARDHGEAMLSRRLEKYQLCRKFCGIDSCSKPDACLYQQINLCKGAGIGMEKPNEYNERVEQLLTDIAYGLPSFFVIGEGRNYDERSVVCVENGAYRGYTYMDASLTTASPEEIRAAIKLRPETPDVQQIIRRYIKQKPKEVRKM